MANDLILTVNALNEPKNLQGVFEIEAFRHNFVDNYAKTTGRTNGALIYDRERVLFMKALGDNKKLESCTRFSVYSAFIELAVSGLTLNDGLTYIIPYGEKAQFQIGWKGRFEQIAHIPIVKMANMPQIVYTSELDDFVYTLGEKPRIIEHKPAKNRGRDKDDVAEFVYFVIDTTFGAVTHLMNRDEVLRIRDQYSQTYNSYVTEIQKQGKKIGDKVTKQMKGRAGAPDWTLTLEPPFWVTNEDEAFKKTLIKRAYKYLPKTDRMKALDTSIANNFDPEDGTGGDAEQINYGIVNEDGTTTKVENKEEPKKTAEKTTTGRQAKAASGKTEPAQPVTPPNTVEADHEEVSSEVNPASELPDLNKADF